MYVKNKTIRTHVNNNGRSTLKTNKMRTHKQIHVGGRGGVSHCTLRSADKKETLKQLLKQ